MYSVRRAGISLWMLCASTLNSQEKISTRSGLKNVHKDFDRVNAKLISNWELFKRLPSDTPIAAANRDRALATIVAVYAKMSVDSILRDHIFHVTALLEVRNPPEPKLLKSFELPRVLHTILVLLRKPGATPLAWEHAATYVASVAMHFPDILQAQPSSINLLVALTRSPHLRARATGVLGVVRLHVLDSEDPVAQSNMGALVASTVSCKPWPERADAAATAYGKHRIETTLIMECTRDMLNAIGRAKETKDLAELGEKLARLILRTEYSLGLAWSKVNPNTEGSTRPPQFPFNRWMEAVPHCATALRKRGGPGDADAADIVETKGLILQARRTEAVALARAALKRSPRVAYFHYVIALGSSGEEGVRSARQGLRCGAKDTTQYVRCGLLYRSAEYGSFLREAPPDARSVGEVSCIYLLMLLLVKGDEALESLPEFKEANEKLEISDEITSFFGMRYNALNSAPRARQIAANTPEAALVRWLERMVLEEAQGAQGSSYGEARVSNEGSYMHPRAGVNDVALYRCSWCGAPSAVLRKCSGCQKTRYCDSECQKQHWTDEHRKACKREARKTDDSRVAEV
ncbi:hypothetical protein BC834DRAFT_844928 [Gloeopeniophorella convolvens]|nr:hypothetical protein BC834DRAFT_844928 [Gloeopeniophorella convolvens]